MGKAQEVCTLSIEDSLNYDIVKATVLRAYELVLEAYRMQMFLYTISKNFVNVKKLSPRICRAHEGEKCFDKWCQASKNQTFDHLRELMLMEEFKNRLPEKIVIYLNEQKTVCLTDAAVLADEFTLTHKKVFSPLVRRDPVPADRKLRSPKSNRCNPVAASTPAEARKCYYCHEQGHLIGSCPPRANQKCQNIISNRFNSN